MNILLLICNNMSQRANLPSFGISNKKNNQNINKPNTQVHKSGYKGKNAFIVVNKL